MTVRRPEVRVGYVRQSGPGTCRDLWQGIYRLRTIGSPIDIRGGVVELGSSLQVDDPVQRVDRGTARFVILDRVLIDSSVDQTQVVQDLSCLGTFAGTEKSGHGNGRQQGDNRDYDHDFHEGESPAAFVEFV